VEQARCGKSEEVFHAYFDGWWVCEGAGRRGWVWM